jgi:hypothetical protein
VHDLGVTGLGRVRGGHDVPPGLVVWRGAVCWWRGTVVLVAWCWHRRADGVVLVALPRRYGAQSLIVKSFIG